MSRLSKANTYAINWLHQEGKNPEDIAGELNLNIEQVKSAIEKAQINNKNTVKTGSEPANKAPDLVINKTVKGNSGVSIMTREASEKQDAVKSRVTSSKYNRNDVIFRPRDNDSK